MPIQDETFKCCEKGKPLERVGRKASGPVMMGSGVAQRLDKCDVQAHSFKEWAFFFGMHANNTVNRRIICRNVC